MQHWKAGNGPGDEASCDLALSKKFARFSHSLVHIFSVKEELCNIIHVRPNWHFCRRFHVLYICTGFLVVTKTDHLQE